MPKKDADAVVENETISINPVEDKSVVAMSLKDLTKSGKVIHHLKFRDGREYAGFESKKGNVFYREDRPMFFR